MKTTTRNKLRTFVYSSILIEVITISVGLGIYSESIRDGVWTKGNPESETLWIECMTNCHMWIWLMWMITCMAVVGATKAEEEKKESENAKE